MIKIHEGEYQILEYNGNEYYRFGPQSWMELMGMSLEDVYNADELEAAYQMMVNQHSSVRVSSKTYETKV